MTISLIAAMGRNRVIGAHNALPWSMPADMAHFRALTHSKPVIMGRKTFESIGKPLPHRLNIIITRDPAYRAKECVVAHDADAALAAASAAKAAGEVMVIGGAEIYSLFLPRAHRMYLTLIDADFSGDTHFPEFAADEWQETSHTAHTPDAANPYPYTFVTLERLSRP